MSQSVTSQSKQILLDKFLTAVQEKAHNSNDGHSNHSLSPELFSDLEQLPKLLNELIVELKSKKINISNARIVAATACELLEFYTLHHVYRKGEEENLKQVIKLLGFLIVGAIKTPVMQENKPIQSEDKQIENPPKASFVSSPSPSNYQDTTLFNHPDNEDKYGVIALKIVDEMFSQPLLNLETILMISSFYCVTWEDIQASRETKSQTFSRLQKILISLDFQDHRPTYKKAIKFLSQLGLREVIGLAEFQYRKQNYIKSKSKFTNSGNLIEESVTYSPLQLLQQNLLNFYQKSKDATASMMFLGNSKVDFDSSPLTYWNYQKEQWGTPEKCLMVFRALVNVCCDGLYRNYRVQCNVLNNVGSRGKSQESFLEVHQEWIHHLSHITRLSVSAKTINNSQFEQFKKSILDWPLSSFFLTNKSEKSKIAQTVIREKIESLSLNDAANLLILLYSNIQKNANPLGQVQSLYAILSDYLSFNKESLEWSKTYLEQQGFSSIEITAILESQEDVENR